MLLRLSATYLAGKLVPAAMTFALLALYTHLLSPADYGDFAFVNATATLVFSLSAMWLCTAAVRLYGRAGDKAAVQWSLGIGFAGVALIVLLGVALATILIQDAQSRALLWLGFLLFLVTAWFELNADMLTASLRAGTCVAMGVIRTALSGALGGVLAYAGFGVEGILTGTVIGIAIPALLMSRAQWRGFRFRPAHPDELRSLLVFGLPLSLSYAVNAVVYSTDRYIVTAFGGAAVLGLYAVGFDLADRVIKSITLPLGTAALPLLVRRYEQDGREGARAQARQNFLLLAGIATPVCLGLIAVTPEFATLMLGEAYRAMAVKIVPIIALTALLGGLRGQYFDHAFHVGLRTRRHVVVVLITAAVNLMAGVLLVQRIGPLGAAYGTLIAFATGLAASIVLGRRAFAMPVPVWSFARILVAALGMMAAVKLISVDNALAGLALKIGLGAIVYAALLLAFDVGGLRTTHGPAAFGARLRRLGISET
jgi:O-antigen/teichoic acid export membrane protein